jgi:hypothetical protein
MDQRSVSAFGLYEGLRILIPGFYFATLFVFFAWCYSPQYDIFLTPGVPLLLLFMFLVLVSGLTMYAKEAAKRRKAFIENQPSNFLKERSKLMKNTELLDDVTARRLYFYILNHHVPQSFHDKIFFFGTVYHVMVLLRRTTFWFAVASVAGILVYLAGGRPLADQGPAVVFAVTVWIIYLLNVRYNKADRKMQENYQDQIFWLEMNHDVVENAIRQFSRSRAAISK